VFYVGHVDKSSLHETLFNCNILSKHHHSEGDIGLYEQSPPLVWSHIFTAAPTISIISGIHIHIIDKATTTAALKTPVIPIPKEI